MPKILTWSLGIQRELYRNGLLEVRYLGTRGLELPVQFRRNHISAFDAANQAEARALTTAYIDDTHEDRTHLGLAKDTPAGRSVARDSADASRIQSFARLGGLHHRYAVAA